MSTEVQWGKFRGRLRRALRDPELAELEPDKLTPADVQRETNGAVKAAVLNKYLDGKRPDLPASYLPLLLGLDPLVLMPGDYMPTTHTHTSEPPKSYQTPAQRAQRQRLTTLDSAFSATRARYGYVSLFCENPEAMRTAFMDRIERAGMTQISLGRSFGQTVNDKHCFELNDFWHKLNKTSDGPFFARKLQERFWEICEFLKDRINEREGESYRSTEEFVIALLREGTVREPEDRTRRLGQLNEHFRGRNSGALDGP